MRDVICFFNLFLFLLFCLFWPSAWLDLWEEVLHLQLRVKWIKEEMKSWNMCRENCWGLLDNSCLNVLFSTVLMTMTGSVSAQFLINIVPLLVWFVSFCCFNTKKANYFYMKWDKVLPRYEEISWGFKGSRFTDYSERWNQTQSEEAGFDCLC